MYYVEDTLDPRHRATKNVVEISVKVVGREGLEPPTKGL